MTDRATCETCRWGEFIPTSYYKDAAGMVNKNAHVKCHRYPPVNGRGANDRWRTTWPSDWCGEFQPKQEPKKP